MIEGLIGIGRPRHGIQQLRQDLGQLAPLMRFSGHRAKVAIGQLDIPQSIGR